MLGLVGGPLGKDTARHRFVGVAQSIVTVLGSFSRRSASGLRHSSQPDSDLQEI